MSWSKRVWACPFYRSDADQRVRCEGGSIKFKSRLAARRYADRFCGSACGWQKCTIAASLVESYEEEDK